MSGGADLFSETLDYEDCGLPGCKPQYNGNISRMVHEMAYNNGDYSGSRDVQYVYDELNRLSKVKDSKQPMFDEMFEYDVQGRIVAQHRAKKTDGQYALNEHPTGGEYTYESGTNRLKSVAANMGGESADNRNMSDPDNFVYDSEGNLTEDKSKGLKISYDWRGMPIEFMQESQPTGSSDNSLFRLTMAYDGSGRRISKTRWVKKLGSQEWEKELVTHYTGIGTEIRENYHNESLDKAKVVVNMPEGLGRYGIEDAEKPDFGGRTGDQLAGYIPNVKFEWYLKNHLGSTMLVYGTEGNATSAPFTLGTPLAAYDYRAFGEQLTLLPAGDKFTENFTGKERDDEIALNYFGARYLDPMLGMWISMDPKRQFASPYLYAGNGVNPVNVIDPDGNYIIWEHDVNNPEYHHYTFSYSSFGDHVIEWFANFIPGSGIVGIIPPKGLVEHSLHPSAAEGAFSTVFDVASNALKLADNVFSGVKLAFKYIGRAKMAYTGLQTLKQHPKLEDYMKNLTKGSSLLSSPNLDDLKKKADWATSYGENLFNQGVEITDEVRAKFHTDFQAEFPNGAKDDN